MDLTLGDDIYLQTPHAVLSLLNSELTHLFSASGTTSYERDHSAFTVKLHLKRCNILNPALA